MYGYSRYRPYGRNWSYKGGKYGKYSRGGTVGRAISSARASKSGTKTETLNVVTSGNCQFTIPQSTALSGVIKFGPYVGGVAQNGLALDATNVLGGAAVNDQSFRMKCASYDEVRLDSMKVTLIPATPFIFGYAVQLLSLVDRKAGPKESGLTGTASSVAGNPPTASEILNSPGVVKYQMNGNVQRRYSRMVRASNLSEKSQFYDCTISYNDTPTMRPTSTIALDAWLKEPAAFSPTFYFACYSNAMNTSGPWDIYCSYQVEYNFTFRNPKTDIPRFIKLENPDYVNPTGRSAVGEPPSVISSVFAQQMERAKASRALGKLSPDEEEVLRKYESSLAPSKLTRTESVDMEELPDEEPEEMKADE